VDLVRFGKNVLFALILFIVVAAASRANFPLAQRFEEYVAFVLTTDLDYEPLLEIGSRLRSSGDGWSIGAWLGSWEERFARVTSPSLDDLAR